jgi:hypothetical protein
MYVKFIFYTKKMQTKGWWEKTLLKEYANEWINNEESHRDVYAKKSNEYLFQALDLSCNQYCHFPYYQLYK